MPINPNTKIVVGMEFDSDTATCAHRYIITKIGRKYAYILRSGHLPDIDRPQKVNISRIYQEFSVPEVRTAPPECARSSNRKEIEVENRMTGERSIIDIEQDRDPENYMKHNASGHRYIKTL